MNSSNWESLDGDHKAMVNTNMVITCPLGTNCTSLKSTPGANIASPVSMFLTGTIGNAVALLVLHRSSRREQMRTVFYLLVQSLLWTDLIGIILTSIPVLVVYSNGRWVGSTGLCNYHAFTMISVGLITPCIVCTLAVERFLGIRHTYFYTRHVNRHLMRLILLVQWIAVLVFTSLPFFGFGQYARQYPGTWCFFDLHATQILHVTYSFCFAFFIMALIIVIIFCNLAVIATLIGMRHRRKHLRSPSRDSNVTRRCNNAVGDVEIQMVILLVGITLLFTICWMPLMLQIVLNQIVDYKNDHRQDLLAIRLVSINQTFDPWIYILFRKVVFTKLWQFVRRIFTGKRPRIKKINELDDCKGDGEVPQLSPRPPSSPKAALTFTPGELVNPTVNGAPTVTLVTHCHKCESQYGDGSSSKVTSSSANGESGESGHNYAAAVSTNDDNGQDENEDDKDSAFCAEEPNSSSAGDGNNATATTVVVASGRCRNCRQLINSIDAPSHSLLYDTSWKSFKRPETMLTVKFLRKHSTKSRLHAADSECPSDDNCGSVQSAIL